MAKTSDDNVGASVAPNLQKTIPAVEAALSLLLRDFLNYLKQAMITIKQLCALLSL